MRRIFMISTAALCAVALSAIAASGASAAETTAFTCVPTTKGAGEFKNAHCASTKPAESETNDWKHVAIAAGESTQLTLSAIGNQVLTSTIGGAAVELKGTALDCEGCMAANSGTAGAMEVSGTGGKLTYTNVVVVKKEEQCVVHPFEEPAGENMITTEPLKFKTIATNEAEISPVTGTLLAKFQITARSGQKCAFAGTYEVKGSVTGVATGATLAVNVTQASGKLTLGVNPASLAGEATIQAGLTEGAHSPTALT